MTDVLNPRQRILLAALAPARGAIHSPVQVQKLLFLIDREIPALIGGPLFDFKPYNYGPFDKSVYDELDALLAQGLVEGVPKLRWTAFRLTDSGQREGDTFLAALPESARDYIARVSAFVRTHSFADLVSAIYKAYPDMKANSIFQQ